MEDFINAFAIVNLPGTGSEKRLAVGREEDLVFLSDTEETDLSLYC